MVKDDPVAAQHVNGEQRLFASRRAAQAAELGAAKQSIVGIEGQIAGVRQMLQSRHAQAALQQRQVDSVRQLSVEGYAPRNQALQVEEAQADLRSSIAESRPAFSALRMRLPRRSCASRSDGRSTSRRIGTVGRCPPRGSRQSGTTRRHHGRSRAHADPRRWTARWWVWQ